MLQCRVLPSNLRSNVLYSLCRCYHPEVSTEGETSYEEDDAYERMAFLSQPKRSVRTKRAEIHRSAIMASRFTKMSTNQDWNSVWPSAKSFNPSSVPLPVFMGYQDSKPRLGKFNNPELMKIPNFLHLTPTNLKKQCRELKKYCTMFCSTGVTVNQADKLILKDFIIPDPPPPPELIPLGPITAKTFKSSLWFPTGWICSMLLYFENFMPYYVAIIAVTVVGRIIMTPVMIFGQKQSAKMALVSPKIADIMQLRKQEELRGNKDQVLKLTYKLAEIYKSTDAFKIKNMMLAPVCSIAVFGSFFIALRRMAYGGHEMMKDGGFGPFYDLTIPDPSYILSAWTALTLFGIMKIGVEFGSITATTSASPIQELFKKVSMFAVPAVIFYATSKMPAAIGLYWATNNSMSICQSMIMLHPAVRKALKIPPTVPKAKEKKDKGIIGSIRKNFTDIKKAWRTSMDDRTARKINDEYVNQFDRSGVGPLRKTYDYDPTKLNLKGKSKR